MPRRRAARKIVSPARMSISRPSMVKILGLPPEFALIDSPDPYRRPREGYPATLASRGPPLGGPIVPHTQASGIWVPACAGTTPERAATSSSPTPERLLQLLRKILEHAQQRIGRSLTETADRSVAHSVRKFRQQGLVPGTGCHQLGRLLGSHSARGALAAAFILEEAHQIERHRLHIVLVGQDDNRV